MRGLRASKMIILVQMVIKLWFFCIIKNYFESTSSHLIEYIQEWFSVGTFSLNIIFHFYNQLKYVSSYPLFGGYLKQVLNCPEKYWGYLGLFSWVSIYYSSDFESNFHPFD